MIYLGPGLDNTHMVNCCSTRQPRFLVGKIFLLKFFNSLESRSGLVLGVNLGKCKYENPLRIEKEERESFCMFVI